MHVALYLRVSTIGQVDGESLPEQERNARSWAEANGHTVAPVYADPGLSGKLPASERPGPAAALDALAGGEVTGLVVRDLDRLARELTIQEAVLAQAWRTPDARVFTFGGEVLRDDPDDPMRKFARQVMGAAAELERSMIVKRMRHGREAKARKGGHAVGPAPYGWRSVNGELHPVPAELAVLDRMRELRASGARQADIAATVNAEGHTARSGGSWTQPVVSRILRRDEARTPAQVAHQAARLEVGS